MFNPPIYEFSRSPLAPTKHSRQSGRTLTSPANLSEAIATYLQSPFPCDADARKYSSCGQHVHPSLPIKLRYPDNTNIHQTSAVVTGLNPKKKKKKLKNSTNPLPPPLVPFSCFIQLQKNASLSYQHAGSLLYIVLYITNPIHDPHSC